MSIKSMFKGAIGEAMGSLAHKMMLDSSTYHELNNVTIHAADGTTQIDHIIVSRYGIFVIEAKNMSGWIFGDANAATWTQSLPGGRKYQFQNPLRQNYRHTRCLSEFLGIEHEKIHSVVMFWGESTFKTHMPENVLDSGYTSYIKSKLEILFSDDEVAQIIDSIQTGRLPRSWHTHHVHLSSLKERHVEHSIYLDIASINPANPKLAGRHYTGIGATKRDKSNVNEGRQLVVQILAMGLIALVAWLIISNVVGGMQRKALERVQHEQQLLAAQQAEIQRQAQQAEILRRQLEATRAQQPRYEQVLVRGRSARECARPDGTLDNYTVRCMNDHYETVLVSGSP